MAIIMLFKEIFAGSHFLSFQRGLDVQADQTVQFKHCVVFIAKIARIW